MPKIKVKKEDNFLMDISLREYIEYYLSKYNKMSSTDLTILIHYHSKNILPFKDLQAYIATLLTKLKKKGKIMKVGDKQWQWINQPD